MTGISCQPDSLLFSPIEPADMWVHFETRPRINYLGAGLKGHLSDSGQQFRAASANDDVVIGYLQVVAELVDQGLSGGIGIQCRVDWLGQCFLDGGYGGHEMLI